MDNKITAFVVDQSDGSRFKVSMSEEDFDALPQDAKGLRFIATVHRTGTGKSLRCAQGSFDGLAEITREE